MQVISHKLPNTIFNWSDHNALMQLCEKQGIQPLNIPNYSQNNTIITTQSTALPVRIISNAYVPQLDSEINKNNMEDAKMQNENTNNQVR